MGNRYRIEIVLITGAVVWLLGAVFVFSTTSKAFGCAALALWLLVFGGLFLLFALAPPDMS